MGGGWCVVGVGGGCGSGGAAGGPGRCRLGFSSPASVAGAMSDELGGGVA